jgi:chaperonin cofactor prefoldin
MQENYEVKQGKYIAFKANGQERFIRSKTLGSEYTEERIKERLAGVTQTVSKAQKSSKNANLIIDIENNIKFAQQAGLQHWAKIQNLKTAANTMNYLTENGILEYAVLTEKYECFRSKKDSVHSRIKAVEKRIKEIDILIKDIEVYRKTKPIVDKLDKVVFKEKYRKEHESEFILFKAAEKALKPLMKDGNAPLIKPLRAEINQLIAEKNALYNEYNSTKNEFSELSKLKQNVDMILGKDNSRDRENLRKRSEDLE